MTGLVPSVPPTQVLELFELPLWAESLARAGALLPLRAIPLGDFPNGDSARVAARSRRTWDADAVLAENVRAAVERNIGLVYGLSHDQIARLQRGERLIVDDGIGRMELSYPAEGAISEEEFEK